MIGDVIGECVEDIADCGGICDGEGNFVSDKVIRCVIGGSANGMYYLIVSNLI